VGFLHNDNKQLQRRYKYIQTHKSKTTLKHDIQILVLELSKIDLIEVQGSNPVIFEYEQNKCGFYTIA
jgi:hypothetical protein